MTQFIAMLAFFAVPATFGQTTFVSQKLSGYRTEVGISGQAAEGALRDLLALAEMRAHPQKMVEGQGFDYEIGTFTRMGEGLRIAVSSDSGELSVVREGATAAISVHDNLGWSLYALMAAAGWKNGASGVYALASPSGMIRCDMEWQGAGWVECTIRLEHVLQ